jgi:hypothetical protein
MSWRGHPLPGYSHDFGRSVRSPMSPAMIIITLVFTVHHLVPPIIKPDLDQEGIVTLGNERSQVSL